MITLEQAKKAINSYYSTKDDVIEGLSNVRVVFTFLKHELPIFAAKIRNKKVAEMYHVVREIINKL